MLGIVNHGCKHPLIQSGETGSARNVKFEKEYRTAPVVLVTMSTGDSGYMKSAAVSDVTPTGFTCCAWYHQSNGSLGGIAAAENIFWIAIGEEK